MDDETYTRSANVKSKISQQHLLAPKKKKVAQKVVVTVKIEGTDKKQKNEGPPSDCWSWRKYGQKPIKGSPYPRGYYRCSTCKGCSAKKQVERCRTDASMLVITYTSSHNHPCPDLLAGKTTTEPEASSSPVTIEHPTTPKQEEGPETEQKKPADRDDGPFHYCQSPSGGSQDIIINKEENPFPEVLETTYESPRCDINEKCSSYTHFMTYSTPKSEENDRFYDELEELPTSAFFSSFMKRNFFEERILVNPS